MPGNGKVSRYYTAWCGNCEHQEDYPFAKSVRECEREMRKEGWKERDGKWWCCGCVEEEADAS